MSWIVLLGVRAVVFAIAIVFVTRRNSGVRIQPRKALPLVALVFAVLNVGLYWLLTGVVSVASLLTLSLVAPLVANALLLYATSRVVKALRIDGIMPLFYASVVITLVHLGLRLIGC